MELHAVDHVAVEATGRVPEVIGLQRPDALALQDELRSIGGLLHGRTIPRCTASSMTFDASGNSQRETSPPKPLVTRSAPSKCRPATRDVCVLSIQSRSPD